MTYQQSVLIGLKIKCKSLLLSLESHDECIVFIQMQISVNADFAVSVDTTSISVIWDATDVDGVSSFSIKLDTVEKGGSASSSTSPVVITGLTPGTTHRLVVETTKDGTTTKPVDTDYTTSMCYLAFYIQY